VADFVVYLLNPNLDREAEIDDFASCELVERFNAVGAWVLTVHAESPTAGLLTSPQYGIEVVRASDGLTLMSGPMVKRKRVRDANNNTLMVSGPDQNVWLARRRAHPQPATSAPPYNSQAYDVRTGVASTVMRQFVDVNTAGSALTSRQVPNLTLASDPAVGSSVTGRARWQSLLELEQELALAGGNLGFRIRKSGSDLVFEIYQPQDKTASVLFSEALGTLAEFEYEATAPTATYLYVGGGGEGTARVIREAPEPDAYSQWSRFEDFADRRDTSDTTELDQSLTKSLTEQGAVTGLRITPIDKPDQQYRTDYDLGDRVTAVVDGEPIQELITEVKTILTPAGALYARPTIGTVNRSGVLRAFDRLRSIGSRLTNLERR
jgi:hypothetical protein